ncbi:MAG: carbohydrate binding family 9 domain-containing protein [Candidatus Krumholzibacteriota bacterium]|nr:carbohydrate binding family 9 domain-containing protein [Candidatus Krumholzibacteriota bacterium]
MDILSIFQRISRSLLVLLICAFIIYIQVGIPAKAGEALKIDPAFCKRIDAVRITNGGIKVDGFLDEHDWKRAPEAGDFIQRAPNDGEPSTEKTSVRLVYDDICIFVGVRAYDSQPDAIRGLLSRRDEDSPSDWIYLAFDSYNDKRTAFEFSVNPAGVQRDAFWSNGEERDENWDAVWDVAISTDEKGWIAEFCIPFSQLRYASNGHTSSWGFQAVRTISRINEDSYWNPVPQDISHIISRFGRLEGLVDLPASKRLEILPYLVTGANIYGDSEGDPFRDGGWGSGEGENPDYRIGLDLQYGLTSDLTLNMSINPDFGQVEQDPSEFNLTAYETYFDEKRPFFVEGANIFNYTIGFGDMDRERVFYSRRIGRSPHLDTEDAERLYGVDDYWESRPSFTKILGAAKMTGRTSNGWSVGILEAVTDKEESIVQIPGEKRFAVTVEPVTNYTVARARREFNNGRSSIGGILTNVYRDIENDDLDYLHSTAITSGIDMEHRWHDDEYSIIAKFIGSHISGSRESMINAQESSVRYYQRPDADHLGVDPDITHMEGFSSTLWGGKFAGEPWRFGIGFNTRTPAFELNDIGYANDADNTMGVLWIGYRDFEPGSVIRNWNLNTNLWKNIDYGWDDTGTGGNVNGYMQFMNYWGVYGGIGGNFERQNNRLLWGGPSVITPWSINSWYGFHSDNRKMLYFSYDGFTAANPEGYSEFDISPGLTVRPSSRFNIRINPSYNLSTSDLQYVDDYSDETGDHYIVGRIDRKTVRITTRIDYTLTNKICLQFYAMPYLTAGKYTRFREVTDPHAASYDDRFTPVDYSDNPDFNFKQLRSNLVFRWEFNPGSTLYFVWSQGATDLEEEYGDFGFSRDFGRLFSSAGDNTFLIKINKWFSL